MLVTEGSGTTAIRGSDGGSMTCRMLATEDPDWGVFLARTRHDIFQVPEYLAVEDGFRGTTTRLLAVEDGEESLLVPIILQELPGGRFDASSPFQYAGPVCSPGSTSAWRRRAVAAVLDHLRGLGVVSVFLRAHPLWGLEEFSEFGEIVDHGPAFVIPLDRSLDEVRSGMRQNHRRNIRRAAKDGLVAEQDVGWSHLETFHEIYTATMDRLDASPAYLYTLDYLEQLRDEVGQQCSLWVLEMEGQVAGAHLVTECDGTVEYLLGATHPDFYRRVPQVAIFDAVLTWAHGRDDRDYVLGGGMQESLRHFKAGFTRDQRPTTTARIVLDQREYDGLRAAWVVDNGAAATSEYFPVYRTPLPSAA